MKPADEIREKKEKLAQDIYNLISAFEQDTGCSISRVNVDHCGIVGSVESWELTGVTVEVSL